jgi:hypothetical protein
MQGTDPHDGTALEYSREKAQETQKDSLTLWERGESFAPFRGYSLVLRSPGKPARQEKAIKS